MKLLGLVSGFLLVLTVPSLAKPQQSTDALLWSGQTDFSNEPVNLIPPELSAQGVVLPTDPTNIMLLRRAKGGPRRKQMRLRQQQVADLDRQLKSGKTQI